MNSLFLYEKLHWLKIIKFLISFFIFNNFDYGLVTLPVYAMDDPTSLSDNISGIKTMFNNAEHISCDKFSQFGDSPVPGEGSVSVVKEKSTLLTKICLNKASTDGLTQNESFFIKQIGSKVKDLCFCFELKNVLYEALQKK